jgi:lysine 2,3-aminomutase
MGKIIIIESKSISEYLQQLEDIGEDAVEYMDIYGYSIGETEPRLGIYEYPEYTFVTTDAYSNLEV